jgi:putative tryptophan/tyrosine transport system substrate-binding protein
MTQSGHRGRKVLAFKSCRASRGGRMQRRQFITLFGSAAAWPLVARAQQSAMAVVGFLRDARAAGSGFLVDGLRKGLAETGFVEGHNLTIEYAWTEGQSARLSTLATELVVRRHVPVIVSSAINANSGDYYGVSPRARNVN